MQERAAQKRVSAQSRKAARAFFNKRGVVLSATAVATMLAAHSVSAAPVGLRRPHFSLWFTAQRQAIPTLTLVKGGL